MSKPTKQILQEARDYLASGKWIRGHFHGYNGTCCALGAIQRASGYRESAFSWPYTERYPAYFNAAAELAKAIPHCWPSTSVPDYNDAEGRTVEDILALFDYAIKGERMPSPGESNED